MSNRSPDELLSAIHKEEAQAKIDALKIAMQEAAEALDFEKAIDLRDEVQTLQELIKKL